MKKELLKKAQGQEEAESDTKKAAIEAAMARVKAKREQQEKKNVVELTEQQKQAIRKVEERRQRLREAESDSEENN